MFQSLRKTGRTYRMASAIAEEIRKGVRCTAIVLDVMQRNRIRNIIIDKLHGEDTDLTHLELTEKTVTCKRTGGSVEIVFPECMAVNNFTGRAFGDDRVVFMDHAVAEDIAPFVLSQWLKWNDMEVK